MKSKKQKSQKKHQQEEAPSTDVDDDEHDNNPVEEGDIFYFGFGPIVNDMVRKRRNIHTKSIQAACLRDFRLTFCFGGNASIVPQRGYEVHGLLMKLESKEDWKRLLEFDSGNSPTLHDVFPYDDPDNPVVAYLFEIQIPEGDVSKLDEPIERLPQERYLKLIAQGLRQHQVDEEYIDYQIMAVPFIPNRKPEEYYTFPQQTTPLPTWTWNTYQKKCAKGNKVYFILGNSIFLLKYTNEDNPLCQWLKFHGHGKRDVTLAVHKTVVDPEIPLADTQEDITPLHIAWAENHCVEVVEQYEMSAVKVAVLKDNEECNNGKSRTWKQRIFSRNTST